MELLSTLKRCQASFTVTAKQNSRKGTASKCSTAENRRFMGEHRNEGLRNIRKQLIKALVILLITLNINGLNYPIERLNYMLCKKRPASALRTHRGLK